MTQPAGFYLTSRGAFYCGSLSSNVVSVLSLETVDVMSHAGVLHPKSRARAWEGRGRRVGRLLFYQDDKHFSSAQPSNPELPSSWSKIGAKSEGFHVARGRSSRRQRRERSLRDRRKGEVSEKTPCTNFMQKY